MAQENEIVTLLLGLGILIFILANRAELHRLPSARTLLAGYYVLVGAWVLTILEGFVWPTLLNLLEHAAYAVSAVLLATWFWRVFRQGEAAP